jgi:hypothetical protein
LEEAFSDQSPVGRFNATVRAGDDVADFAAFYRTELACVAPERESMSWEHQPQVIGSQAGLQRRQCANLFWAHFNPGHRPRIRAADPCRQSQIPRKLIFSDLNFYG